MDPFSHHFTYPRCMWWCYSASLRQGTTASPIAGKYALFKYSLKEARLKSCLSEVEALYTRRTPLSKVFTEENRSFSLFKIRGDPHMAQSNAKINLASRADEMDFRVLVAVLHGNDVLLHGKHDGRLYENEVYIADTLPPGHG